MANPITGPVTTQTIMQFGTDQKQKWTQQPPYNINLPYVRIVQVSKETSHVQYWLYGSSGWYLTSVSSVNKGLTFNANSFSRYATEKTHTTNRAYAKLVDRVKSQSGWAESIAQASTARAMFNSRATQVWGIVKFLMGRGTARIPPSLKQRSKTPLPDKSLLKLRSYKDPASTFLEVEYGWRPLISDIYASIKLLGSDPPFGVVKASAKSTWNENVATRTVPNPGDLTNVVDTKTIELSISTGAFFSVSNPNTFLLNSLGLIDPALPWKLIPYSFVVDWFVNVEQCISSVSDWYGLQILNPYTTTFSKCTRNMVTVNHFAMNSSMPSSSRFHTVASAVEMRRDQTLAGPSLTLKPFRGFSLERGAQALSLIVTGLGGKSSGNYRL